MIPAQPTDNKNYHLPSLLSAILLLTVLAAYVNIYNLDFINYDDPEYLNENPHVRSGLNLESISWAFTNTTTGNWHPITWLSHTLDCQLFGLNPTAHHVINLCLHLANSLLLLWLLIAFTNRVWPSAFVAALFALHPLHVESVAWVAERKDLLSAFFWLLTTAAYLRYVKSTRSLWYLLTVLFFILGLMAKPMMVTLPFVLLLLDYWPLERIQSGFRSALKTKIFIEKIPLIFLATVFSCIAFFAQRSAGAISTFQLLPLKLRLGNAFLSYLAYIGKMITPVNLTPFYLHPAQNISFWQVTGAALLLVLFSIIILHLAPKHRYLLTGWLWYLGTLIPVIGLIQIGDQAMADRYTYIPSIGLFIIIVWSVTELTAGWKMRKLLLAAVGSAALCAMIILTNVQVSCWQNNFTLYEHTLAVTKNNAAIHTHYASALSSAGKTEQAIDHYNQALQIDPNHLFALNNLGLIYANQGKFEQARLKLQKAIRIKPDFPYALANLGLVLLEQGDIANAIKHYEKALEIYPDYPQAHNGLGIAYGKSDLLDQSMFHFNRAIQLKPNLAEAYGNLALARLLSGDSEQAAVLLQKAIEINPNLINARYQLARIMADKNKICDAAEHMQKIIQLQPDFPEALTTLAWYLSAWPDYDCHNPTKAVSLAQKACEITFFQDPVILDTLAIAYAAAGDFQKAITTTQKALELLEYSQQSQFLYDIQQRLNLYQNNNPFTVP